MRSIALVSLLALTACGGGGSGSHPSPVPAPPSTAWEAGPTLPPRGNYSAGTVVSQDGDTITVTIPAQGQGETHYITRAGGWAGKHVMRVRYTLAGAVEPVGYPAYQTPRITAYFQRAGDNWSCAGKYDPYRWYDTPTSQVLSAPGSYELVASLDDAWTGCQSSTKANDPNSFAAAVGSAGRIGVVFGGGDGYGHGVFGLNGPAVVTLTVTFE